eukprot:gb/GEZN01004850.1/.p1 GENE.gb/GEZN01004850.1/~~gb/GEZN01004850.1/.p1  ORF type:complete len:559 (+),score=71.49 gb/GEZN01004850.1/:204-1679(+)
MVWGIDSDEDGDSMARLDFEQELCMIRATAPPRSCRAVFSQLGPGVVVAVSILGVGEVFPTSASGAQCGVGVLWFFVLCSISTVWLQVELTKYSLCTKQSSMALLNSVGGPAFCRLKWPLWLWLAILFGQIAREGALLWALPSLLVDRAMEPHWHLALYVLITMLLWVGLICGSYAFLEKFCLGLVGLVTLFTIVVLVGCHFSDDGCRLASADFLGSFELPSTFSSAFYTFGLGGLSFQRLLFYPYWCLEKGYGERIGSKMDRTEQAGEDGPKEGELVEQGWLRRANGWSRVMRVDVLCSYAICTVLLLGLQLISYDSTTLPSIPNTAIGQGALYWLSVTLEGRLGQRYGSILFRSLLLSLMASGSFINSASLSRCLADLFLLCGGQPYDLQHDQQKIGIFATVYVLVVFLSGILLEQAGPPVFIGVFGSAVFLCFFALWVLVLTERRLDIRLRAGTTWRLLFYLSVIFLVLMGLCGCIVSVEVLRSSLRP